MIAGMGIDTGAIRDAIVAALSLVDADVGGVPVRLAAHPTHPNTPAAYDAWPVFVDARPFSMCDAETDWHVLVALPAADQTTTVDAGDALVNSTCDALMAIGKVTHVRPARWILAEGGEIPVWQFEMTF